MCMLKNERFSTAWAVLRSFTSSKSFGTITFSTQTMTQLVLIISLAPQGLPRCVATVFVVEKNVILACIWYIFYNLAPQRDLKATHTCMVHMDLGFFQHTLHYHKKEDMRWKFSFPLLYVDSSEKVAHSTLNSSRFRKISSQPLSYKHC